MKTSHVLVGVGALGTTGWIAWRMYQRNKLVEMLQVWPPFRERAAELAAEQVGYFNTTSADEGYRAITGADPSLWTTLLGLTGPAGEKVGDVVQKGYETYDKGGNVYSSGKKTAASWYDWAKSYTPWGVIDIGADPSSGGSLLSTVTMLSVPAAAALSYHRNRSIGWAALHGFLSLTYLAYRGIEAVASKQVATSNPDAYAGVRALLEKKEVA